MAAWARGLGPSLLWAGLSGGEPTLRPDFPDIAEAVARACPNLVLLSFGTNGLDPERVEGAARRIARLEIPFIMAALSLDGLKADHDRARGVEGAFEKAMESARRLRRIQREFPHFSLSFQTTVSPLNRNGLNDLADFLRREHPDATHIVTVATDSFLVNRGCAPELAAGPEEIRTVRDLARKNRVRSLTDLPPLAYLGLVDEFLQSGQSPIRCVAGQDMLIVDPAGGVRPCDFVREAVANLADYGDDFPRLLADPLVHARLESYAHCRDCFSPCQAFPSLFRSPKDLLRGLWLSAFRR